MASIALEHVDKIFANGQAAARDLTLEIPDGELLTLVGPSGSGKSTVLRLIAGLERPTGGRIVIDGTDVTGVPPERRDLAMVFQSYALYPHKSVRDNLAFALRVRGVATADIDRRVETTAAALGLERLLDRRPSQLSGGQRQRVALGRAIVREPKAFLLDEPLSNLDPLLRLETRSEIALLHRRLGATMVYVTHDQEEAMTLGRRVAVMRDGTLEQVGAPLDLFRRPANVFVATFIGSPAMNVWQCRCETTAAAQMRATCGPFSLDIPGSRLNGRPAGRVMVGVRPQDIALAARDESDVPARVEIVEPLGATAVVHARISGDAPLIRVVVSADDVPAVDDEVGLRVRRDRLHLFDAETGVSLDAVDAAR